MFRFTIRDVLWLTALIAVGAGWLADHWQMASALEDARHDAREIWYRLEKLESSIWG